jgi:cytochrome c2
MIARISAAIVTLVASAFVGPGAAFAGCAEDLTRIQLAGASASPDIRAAVEGLVATAQAGAKANDFAGCARATSEALNLLGLPILAPITLSTPVPGVDRQLQPPQPAVSGAQAPAADRPPPGALTAERSLGRKKRADNGARKIAARATLPAAASADWYVVTSNVIGSDVTAQDRADESIGRIKALVIDSTTRQTTLALIETGGLLGFGGKLIAVPFSAIQFLGRWDRPLIRADVATIQSGPRVTTSDVPDLVSTAKWRSDLAKHFNVAPLPSPNVLVVTRARPTVMAAAPPAGEATGDPNAGRTYVQGICGACHTFDQGGGTRVGPNLYGIVGRKIAGDAGFGYSPALKDHGGSWTAANLDGFLKTPQGFAPGTTMPFSGISSNNERRNVIAYLETLGTAQGERK